MTENDYCVFVPTYKRANNVITYKTLRDGGYNGKIYLVVDDKDPELEEYKKNYKDRVLVFSKDEIAKRIDVCDNFPEKNSVIYARNKIPELAKDVGVKYYLVLDDYYNRISYRRCYGNILRTFKVIGALISSSSTLSISSIRFFISFSLPLNCLKASFPPFLSAW